MKAIIKNLKNTFLPGTLLIICLLNLNACKKEDNSYNSGGTPTSGTPPANEVWAQGMSFNPTTLSVAVNTTVKWTNKDGYAHTVTSNSGLFDGHMAAGAPFSYTFTATGSFPYHCNIHSGMTGTVTVH